MREITAPNIWTFQRNDSHIVIPTNGFVKSNGRAVMGRGLAAQCANYYPDMPKRLGEHIEGNGNHVGEFWTIRQYNSPEHFIFTFPVKHKWWEDADLELIERSAKELAEMTEGKIYRVYLPLVGCGNGRLKWEDVKPILQKYLLGHRYLVVHQGEKK